MTIDSRDLSPEHAAMAQTALDVFDTRFFKALCEPTRVEIIRKLVLLGACDVSTIAGALGGNVPNGGMDGKLQAGI